MLASTATGAERAAVCQPLAPGAEVKVTVASNCPSGPQSRPSRRSVSLASLAARQYFSPVIAPARSTENFMPSSTGVPSLLATAPSTGRPPNTLKVSGITGAVTVTISWSGVALRMFRLSSIARARTRYSPSAAGRHR